MKKILSVSLVITSMFLSANAYAERYIGVQLGWSMPENFTKTKGDENLGYSTSTPDVQYGSQVSNAELEDSVYFGIKVGKYFENRSNLGIEGEFAYTQPDFKRQNIYLTHQNYSNYPGLGGGDTFFEDQLPASADLYTIGINALYRFQTEANKIRPYIGAGPALYLWHIKGTGNSCRVNGNAASECSAPDVNEKAVGLGLVAKLGASHDINEKVVLDLEYKYNWNRQGFDQFRSLSKIDTTYQAHNLLLSLSYKF